MKKIILTITLIIMTFISFTVVFGETLAQESQFNNITIFIRFNDEQDYTAPYEYSHYDGMLNGVNQPSLRNYYLEASYGTLTIDSFIPVDNGNIIFYTDIYDREYFEPVSDENPNGLEENDQADREHYLIKRAMDYVDEQNLVPDELNLDVNEDGMIDSLTFMISGEDSGWNSLLWPHKWELFTFGSSYGFAGDAPTINGVNGYYYTWELLGNSIYYNNQVNVGVLAHETFHLLGAPDLYHYYEYLDIEPVGEWGLMEYNGEIPSHMLGYMKERYAGWITDVPEIYESGSYTLYPLQDDPSNIYRIFTGVENQWIYLEYRDDDGFYESNLPYSGLLVYRVNLGLDGNADGSYDDEGNPTDEVFVFRPGMDDLIDPIVLLDADVDGDIYRAALTDYSFYPDEMGLGTNIPIFLSDGTVLQMGIYNVDERDGYITFSVVMESQIELESDDYNLRGKNVMLYDSEHMEYSVNVTNLVPGMSVYYTLDGSTPDFYDNEYIHGSSIGIDSTNNVVKVAIYNGTQLIQTIEKEFDFSTTIESEHFPYGNNLDVYYFLDFGEDTGFSIGFDNRSELEEDYDYININVNDTIESLTGIEMRTYYEEFQTDEFLIQFETDEYVDSYFGMLVTLEIEDYIDLNVFGPLEYTVSIFEEYIDPGVEVIGTNLDDYTLEIEGVVDVNMIGTYVLTYIVKDLSDEIILQEERIVYVLDNVAPEVDLIGSTEIDINVTDEYVDQYINFSDNYDDDLIVETIGEVNTEIIGTYTITYSVTDQSGNSTEVERTINVVDVQAPTGFILEGVDTVIIGEDWIDSGVDALDNYSDELDVQLLGYINTNEVGIYQLQYIVSDSSNNQLTLSRVITVVEEEITDPVFACRLMVTTIASDDQLVLSPCYVDGEETEIDRSDVSMTVGIHEIIYFIEIENVRFEHKVYYYVYQEGTVFNEVAYIERRHQI